jgi:phage terminase large subunit-like protein
VGRRRREGVGERARRYILDVQKGRAVVGRLVELAVERHVRDLKEAHRRGYWFDEAAAGRVLRFVGLLRHWKGQWSGQPVTPEPWQAFILWSVFGWKRQDGTRRFREVYQEVAKKNGKTLMIGAVGDYLVIADGEPGADVYTAATKLDQARIPHRDAIEMLRRSPELLKYTEIYKDAITVPETSSKYLPLGADSTTMDGLNVHGAIIDELHAHKNRGVVDQLITATASRSQPLVWEATTAGYDRNSICWEKRQYGVNILDRTYPEDTDTDAFFAYIATLDEGDDWKDEKTWIKANPNLGVSVNLDTLRAQALKAQRSPAFENAFKRFRLNIWTEQLERWLSIEAWDTCGYEEEKAPEHLPDPVPLELEQFQGRPAWGGLDLAQTQDLSALGWVIPRDEDADELDEDEGGDDEDLEDGAVEEESRTVYDVVLRFFIPEERMKERVERDKVPYDVWVRQGFIQTTPGNVIDYAWIKKQLLEDAKILQVREVAFDPHNAIQLTLQLSDEGMPMVPFSQGILNMSPPTKDLMTKVLSRRMRHHRNPVLRWMAGNLVVKVDENGNLKPDKKRSAEKIDGMVALIMGIARASLRGGDGDSVYETEKL